MKMEIDPITFDDMYGSESDLRDLPEPDAKILTSDGIRIPVHSSVLISVSAVFESIMDRPRKSRSSEKLIPILGVPRNAVASFVRFLYTSRCDADQLEQYAIHLLALSHVYMVPQLKTVCKRELSQRLTTEIVIDVLQLARLCDAPDLYLSCLKLVSAHFKAVEATEAWKFLQDNDPWLELEILQYIDESESRRKRTKRRREAESVYMQLSEAMVCLEHICKEGCTSVGPHDVDPAMKRGPCTRYSTCHGLQLSIQHFATCGKRLAGGCVRCKRVWQLLRLHSCICEHSDSCKVPLCRQFKLRMQQERKRDDTMWKLLVKKVLCAKTISSLSLPKRKREEMEQGERLEESQGCRSHTHTH